MGTRILRIVRIKIDSLWPQGYNESILIRTIRKIRVPVLSAGGGADQIESFHYSR